MTVKIYTTTHCPYCKMAKDFLKENKIEFEEINVEENHEAAHEMIVNSGQSTVPVIDVDGKIIIGFNKEELKKHLNL